MKISNNKIFSKIINIVPAIIILTIVLKIFIFSDYISWQKQYDQFSIPSNTYPGGDARNIQLTAYCEVNYNDNFKDCYKLAKPIVEIYPEANVPPNNYPKLWSYTYGLFDNFSEEFFMNFWRANAIALFITLFLLALRTNHAFFAIAAFSPVTILTIERGNIDAITFFILYIPILLTTKAHKFNSLFILLAASAKVFPIFALPIFFLKIFQNNFKVIIMGFIISSPLLVWSFKDIFVFSEYTSYGFKVAYGFLSLLNAPFFSDNHEIAYFVLSLYVLGIIFYINFEKKNKIYNDLIREISLLSKRDSFLFFTSILIFGLTFVFSISWAYRLIFLFPALFILSNLLSKFSKILLFIIILVFWSPVLGWNLQNLMCYILFFFISPIYFRVFILFKKFNKINLYFVK
jgi:hypothetical protein